MTLNLSYFGMIFARCEQKPFTKSLNLLPQRSDYISLNSVRGEKNSRVVVQIK